MLSIIICTYNRERYIYNVLKSIAENNFPFDKYEIVLINNNSTDKTEPECNRFQNDFPQVNYHYFIETNQGLSHARNRGICEAKGNILIYVDDDALVNKEYLNAYYELFAHEKEVYAAGGPIIPKYETEEPKWFSYFTKELITGYLYMGNKIKKFSRRYPGGGNAAYRKEVFEKIGLFNVELGRKGDNLAGSEEKDIFDKMTALGMQFLYIPNAVLYHIIPETKLTNDYFNRLTRTIGQSERVRTYGISKTKYMKRLFLESIKWMVSFVLCLGFILRCAPQKGFKLLAFRLNVTKGLLEYNEQIKQKIGNRKSKITYLFLFSCLFLSRSLFAQYTETDIYNYIETYKGIAIQKMVEYKIPASITLAQGIFESACGTSRLATQGNNHFGIKCHKEWQGDTIKHDDDALQECFRKYKEAEESYNDHSLFLTSRHRYAKLFTLDVMDYTAWAHGLKAAGYATNPKYADRLISLIERFNLAKQDTIAMQLFEDKIKPK